MRKGLFFGSAFVAVAVGGAMIAYLLAPIRKAIVGTVTTVEGRAIRDAAVELTPVEGNRAAKRVTRTDGRGWFAFQELAEGTYDLDVRTPLGGRSTMRGIPLGSRLTVSVTEAAAASTPGAR
ncbi:MAG: carboxypeptidase regulatory-like domain-containing protein [Planctomycetes bacterium]|nr:carboxypeptidase regulatory-like domain-containing protein [Planctomycetota bacterium]